VSWTGARDAIYTHFIANSPVAEARIDKSAFNGVAEKFNPPAPDFTTPANSTWVRPQVDSVPGSSPIGIGADAMMQRRGLLTVAHFFMRGTGETDTAIVNTTITAFHRQMIAGTGLVAEFEDADEPDAIGITDDSSWYQINVQVPFRIQEASP